MQRSKLRISVSLFISGMVLMIFELVGARIIAPYYGTSIAIWTSVIGVIMGSLAVGYYYGGYIADNQSTKLKYKLVINFFMISVSLLILLVCKAVILSISTTYFDDIRIGALAVALVLFSFPSFLFGAISPISIKILADTILNVGSLTGRLYAISTLGSIVGTFLSGFYLIPSIGIHNSLVFCIVSVLVAGLIIKVDWKLMTFALLITLLSVLTLYEKSSSSKIEFDTAFHHVQVYKGTDKTTGKKIKILQLNDYISASIFLDSDELVYDYLKFYKIGELINPDIKQVMMIGGSVCTFPKALINRNKEVTVDIIEIDKALIELAHTDFNLPVDKRLNFYYEDARTYLNRNMKKYDMIYSDAFVSAIDLPYQLTTKEAITKCYDQLTDSGAYILNIVSTLENGKREFLDKEYSTCKSVFHYVYLFRVNPELSDEKLQSICLVASKYKLDLSTYYQKHLITEVVSEMELFTDNKIDYIPVY